MALNYHRCAKEILRNVGGKRNLVDGTHCSTRLRLEIANEKRINMNSLEQIDGVKGVYFDDGLLQIILGSGTVDHVYDEFAKIARLNEEKIRDKTRLDAPLFKRLLRVPGNIFIPILPVIMGYGLLLGLLKVVLFLSADAVSSNLYQVMEMTARAAFLFMPILVSISTAEQYGGSVYLAVLTALCMVHFGDEADLGSILFSPLYEASYNGRVIPFILTIVFMCRTERLMRQRLPNSLHLYFGPLVTLVLTILVGVGLVGPIVGAIEGMCVDIVGNLFKLWKGIPGGVVLGACYPLSVIAGWHHLFIIVELGLLTEYGGDANILMPMISAANFAQFGACLGVALKTKNTKTKQKAFPAALSAAFGITEPALYGVNLHYRMPLYFGMVGGALGAVYAAVKGIGSYAFEITGLPGYLIADKPLAYTVLLLISGGVACVLTLLLWRQPEEANDETLFLIDGKPVLSPVKGKRIPPWEIPDPLFAEETMGPTAGILPDEGVVYAPFDAKVVMVFPTKHAIGLKREDGLEMLIHIGVDTAPLGDKAFRAFVETDQDVREGDVLIRFDRRVIADANLNDVVTIILTNTAGSEKVERA